jgi:hypothetical protein
VSSVPGGVLATTLDGGTYSNLVSFDLTSLGNVTLTAGDITISGGAGSAVNLTITGSNVTIDNENLTITGNLVINSVSYKPLTSSFAHNDYITNSVIIRNHSTLSGASVSITAQADGAHYDNPIDFGGGIAGSIINSTPVLNFINNLSLLVSVAKETASATISVDATSTVTATIGDVTIIAQATGSVLPSPTISKLLGVAVAILNDTADVEIAGHINAGGSITLFAAVTNTVNAVSDASGAGKKGGAAGAVAVAVVNSLSQVEVASTAVLTAGNHNADGSIQIQATTIDSTRVVSRATTGTAGSNGVAIGVDVENTVTNAYLDGKASTS